MIPAVEIGGARVFLGDCRDVLKTLPDNSVDSIVTDPPYELGFMGKSWDSSGIAYDVTVWQECLRVLKPGGHILAFGGSRTWHRLAVAVEDAGFEIRDNIARFYSDPNYCGCEFPEAQMVDWSYGTGEPQTEHRVRPMRDTGLSQTLDVETQRGEVLQPVVSEQGLSSAERAESSQGFEDGKESGLEGRGDVQASEGELHGGEVRSSAGVGQTNGAGGRLHHGAPFGDGSDVRVSFDSDGGGESQGSQSGKQSPVEPGVVSDERGPQAGRSWPICARCGKPLQPTSSGNLAWVMGSGFPKSLDVSKAIDKRAGAERKVTGRVIAGIAPGTGNAVGGPKPFVDVKENPITPEAKTWQGWGTALKPAFEPVVVGRKPLIGTVAENVLLWGVGGLNIDGSRIGTGTGESRTVSYPDIRGDNYQQGKEAYLERGTVERVVKDQGRWPANVVLDEFTAGLLDEQSGVLKSGNLSPHHKLSASDNNSMSGPNQGRNPRAEFGGDTGGASRFFYQAKASKRDRNEGLEDLDFQRVGSFNGDVDVTPGRKIGANPDQPNLPGKNHHPTVKPTQLMRYLIKLVTPEGGTVLDPFTGSGSTGKAALLDGYEFIGAELTEEYLPIIEGRLRWAHEQGDNEDDTLF